MKRIVFGGIAFLALAGVIGFFATGGGAGVVGGGGGGTAPARVATTPIGAPQAVAGDLAAVEAGPASVPTAAAGSGSEIGAIGNLPVIGPDIVKTAQLSVVVKRGTFGDAFGSASMVAGRYGGYVESSSTAGTKSRSGRLLIRVPNASFEQALRDLRGLGDVRSQSISGQDVTSQFVDLEARLRTWEAQEAVLLKLMRQATTVEDTLRVQRELQDVQFRIEQIKGQLRVLRNQTELATIAVSLREAGVPVQQAPVGNRPSLGEAWDRAVNGFLGVLYAVVVGLGYLIPVALLGLVVGFGYRRLRPVGQVSR